MDARVEAAKERYRRLHALRPDLYRKAVEIGSLVTCCHQAEVGGDGSLDLLPFGARVESAVVAILLELVEVETA